MNKHWSIFCWLILLFWLPRPAQAQLLPDSLQNILDRGVEDLATARAYLEVAKFRQKSQLDSVIFYTEESIRISTTLGTPAVLAEARYFLHLKHQENLDFPKAYFNLQEMLKQAQLAKDSALKAKALFSLGAHFQKTTPPLYDSSIYFLQQAERIWEAQKQETKKWPIFIEYGHLYQALGEFELAQKYYSQAYQLAQKSPQTATQIGIALFSLTRFYRSTENWSKYSESLEEYLSYYAEAQGTIWLDPHHAEDIILSEEEFLRHPDWIAKVIGQHQTQQHSRALVLNLVSLGRYYHASRQSQAAKETWQQAVEIGELLKDTTLLVEMSTFALENAAEQQSSQVAFQWLQYKTQLEDALYQREIDARLQGLQEQYETEKKEQELQIQGLELTQKTFERNGLLGSSIFLGFVAIGIFIGFRYRIQANQKIAQQEESLRIQKIHSLQQEQQILGVEAMVEGQEKERVRIAKDLHDSLGGLLMTVKAHFNALSPTVSPTKEYHQTNELIDAACVEVRRISHRMMPRTLALSGLKEALEDLADQTTQEGLDCNLEIIGLDEEPDAHRNVMIYRVIQELVENVQQHAKATQLFIQIFRHSGQLLILVEDNGQGFTPHEVPITTGHGLEGVKARVDFLKGNMDVDSVVGEGTTVNIQLPFRI
ncbi:MAG: ATP-binding protein [Bacteroidota bacterium]